MREDRRPKYRREREDSRPKYWVERRQQTKVLEKEKTEDQSQQIQQVSLFDFHHIS